MKIDLKSLNFTKEFKKFLTSLKEFERNWVLWYVVMNYECSIESFLLLLDTLNNETWKKVSFTSNFISSMRKEHYLNEFTETESNYLREKLRELDGTLLCDIISRTLKNHKIFN